MESPNAGETRGLCELKTRGLVQMTERLLARVSPGSDGARRYEGGAYVIEERAGVLTVRSGGEVLLEWEGGLPRVNRLGARDLFGIARLESKARTSG